MRIKENLLKEFLGSILNVGFLLPGRSSEMVSGI